MPEGAQRVVIERWELGWRISDEEGEFAQASTVDGAISYATDLLEGPGTGVRAFLKRYATKVHAAHGGAS